jgi:metal-sulfur cluster biosynthetic enzyme
MSEVTVQERTDKLMTALRDVVDPELGLNVVELGLIRGVKLKDTSAHITMILTTPFCPYAPALISQVRLTAERTLGVPTVVEMGMEMWDPSMMEEGAGGDWGLF